MEPASVTSAIDSRLIRILAQMALRVLDQGLDAPSRERLSQASPEHPDTPEPSADAPKGRAR
jgi:hypothetical protein